METVEPILIAGAALDQYLAFGWYRMGMHIFTTHSYFYEEKEYNVFWLRYNLHKYKPKPAHLKLLQKTADFNITNQPIIITEELELLYSKYYQQLSFDASPTLQEVLYSCTTNPDVTRVQFDSRLITISDKGTLLAAGVYDMGTQSIAGIVNFYDPAYKKFSFGKVLVLMKLAIAKENKMPYYYPGYIIPGVAKFDYKTFVGEDCIEVWDKETETWIAYKDFFSSL